MIKHSLLFVVISWIFSGLSVRQSRALLKSRQQASVFTLLFMVAADAAGQKPRFFDVGGLRTSRNGPRFRHTDPDKGIKQQVFGRITHGPLDIVSILYTHSPDKGNGSGQPCRGQRLL